MIQTRKHLVLGLTALALSLGASAFTKADTLVLPTQTHIAATDFNGTFNFARFDTLGGTRVLNSVRIDLGTDFTSEISVTNDPLASGPSTGNAKAEVQSGLTDSGIFLTGGNILSISGGNFGLTDDVLSSPLVFTNLAPGATASGTVTGSHSKTGTFSSGAVLAEFTGVGNQGILYDTLTTTVLNFTGGNLSATQTTTDTLAATVTYNFTTVVTGTPEPGSVAMFFGMGVTGMAFIYRRRLKK